MTVEGASVAAVVRAFGLGSPPPSGRVRINLDAHLAEIRSSARHVARHHAAVDPEFVDLGAVAAHRIDKVAGLVADRIERGGGDLGRT